MLHERVSERVTAEADQAEAVRLASLEALDLLDSPREEGFDRIVRLIKAIFRVPIALVSLIDAHRQWYKSCDGLAVGEAARRDTFCKYILDDPSPLIVPDTLLDPRFSAHPSVVGEPKLRFYAGVPLRAPDGQTIGTLCAIDVEPRAFSRRQAAILGDLAEVAMAEFELRQLVATDALTGVLSRRAFRQACKDALALARRYRRPLSVLAFDLDHFKQVNDGHGHHAGDRVLSAVGRACLGELREADAVGRIGGEEFAVLLPETDGASALKVAEKLRAAVAALRVDIGGTELSLTASFGAASLGTGMDDADALLAAADVALYQAKSAGRNRCVSAARRSGAAALRRRVLKAGRILFHDRMSTIDCTVRSLGEGGAGLDVTSTIGIPERFNLVIRNDGLDSACRIVAQTEKHLEVEFC